MQYPDSWIGKIVPEICSCTVKCRRMLVTSKGMSSYFRPETEVKLHFFIGYDLEHWTQCLLDLPDRTRPEHEKAYRDAHEEDNVGR